MNKSLVVKSAAIAISVITLGGAASAEPPVSFAGQKIAINIGYGPGGGYDTYARALAAYYGKHIPGDPTMVPRNMSGAGGLVVGNYIYSVAPKDGTELGAFASSTAMEPLMGDPKAKFDPSKFSWIGSMSGDISFCGLWQRPGALTSFRQMLKKRVVFGSSGGASTSQLHALVLKNLLHAKIKIIPGYSGTREMMLAMRRGEIDGICSLFVSSIMSDFRKEVQSGELKLVIQMGPKTTDVFGKVPSVYDFVKSKQDKQVLDLFFKQLQLGRPVVGPPGLAGDKLATLRTAFMATMRDPAFLQYAKKLNIQIDPMTGMEAEKLVRTFVNYPPSVIKKAQSVIAQ